MGLRPGFRLRLRLLLPLRQAALLVLLAVPPALLTAFLHPARPAWPGSAPALAADEVTLTQTRSDPALASALWIDARSAAAYAAGHHPGALRLTEADWESLLVPILDVWQPGRPLIVYCDSTSCAAASSVAARLRRELAADPVFVLHGGWQSLSAR